MFFNSFFVFFFTFSLSTQVRISVGCQIWTIRPRLALLCRPRFGDHSWANCGSFGFTNFGSQHRLLVSGFWATVEPIVGIILTRFRCHCTSNCWPNYGPDSIRRSGQLWRIDLDDCDSSVGHLWAMVEPIFDILLTRLYKHLLPNKAHLRHPASGQLFTPMSNVLGSLFQFHPSIEPNSCCFVCLDYSLNTHYFQSFFELSQIWTYRFSTQNIKSPDKQTN